MTRKDYFPPAHPEKKRNAAIADLRKGMRPSDVAHKYGIPGQTASTWKTRHVTAVAHKDGPDPGHPTFAPKKAKGKTMAPSKPTRPSRSKTTANHDDIEQMVGKFLGTLGKVLAPAMRQLVDLAVQRKLDTAKKNMLLALGSR